MSYSKQTWSNGVSGNTPLSASRMQHIEDGLEEVVYGRGTITASADTTTLTISDSQVQVVSGSTTHTVKLPTTSVKAGMRWTVVNNSSGAVTVQSSGSNTIGTVLAGGVGVYMARVDTPTTAGNWAEIIDAELAALAGLVSAANKLAYFTGSGTASLTDLSAFARTILDDADAAAVRTTIDAQQADTDLAAIAALVSAANKLPYATGSGTWSLADLTSFARTLLDDADANTARATLGLVIGTDVQAYDAELAALAGVTSAANKLPYFNGSGSAAVIDFTAVSRTFLGAADVAAQLSLLGLAAMATAATASTLAQRDSNANITADNFITTRASTVTAAGTTTLTIDSPQVQVFTGSTTQNCDLPTTSVIAGQCYTVDNQSSGTVTVRSSAGNSIQALGGTRVGVFMARVDTPTAASDWIVVGLTGSSSASNTSTALRDSNGQLFANAIWATRTSTATAAGTTALTISSTQVQVFTGSTTQTVTLPTTSIVAGMRYTIINNSSGSVTVQSSGANTVSTLTTGTQKDFVAQVDTPTAAADWRAI